MIISKLKNFAKRSLTIHRASKFVRDAHMIPLNKWSDPEQLRAVFKVLPNTMLTMPRLFNAYDAIVQINNEALAGDIIECGVWNGGCVGLMALANSARPGPKRMFHLFDSFEGLPLASSNDTHAPDRRGHNDWKLEPSGACVGQSQPNVEAFLVKHLGLNRNDLVFHVGWFQHTLPLAHSIKDIALLRLDGDLYESTKTCLEHLFPKVVTSGYVIIDDYGEFPGCKKAVDEFMERHSVDPTWKQSDKFCWYFRKP